MPERGYRPDCGFGGHNLMTSVGPSLDDYQRKGGREIRVVILERI